MDMSGFINLMLMVMLLTGLAAGLVFIGLHMLIRKLEEGSGPH